MTDWLTWLQRHTEKKALIKRFMYNKIFRDPLDDSQ